MAFGTKTRNATKLLGLIFQRSLVIICFLQILFKEVYDLKNTKGETGSQSFPHLLGQINVTLSCSTTKNFMDLRVGYAY